MLPFTGVLPSESGITTPHPDGTTPWFSSESEFNANYSGPSFSVSSADFDAGSGDGPFGYGTINYFGDPLPAPAEFTDVSTVLATPEDGAGLMMGNVTRDSLLDLAPWIREAVSDASSSGDSPPVWFAMIFDGAGLLVILIGLFSLGYRVTLSKRHSRLHLERRWTIFVVNSLYDGSEFTELEVKQNGHVNEEPRYRLSGLLRGGKKVSLARYASAEDVGQLYARVAEMMPRESR